MIINEFTYHPSVPIIWLKEGDCEGFIMGLEVDCSLFLLARPSDMIDPVTYIFGST